ncbi:MAG: CDGSH iron-sulfur domain-containing protein [Rubrobacter sp.]|nr:CDGSH iron-sulfur domain-containing protein [Rubrobacter sp.]
MTRKAYRSEKITVSFDVERCIHFAECVRGLPEVFDIDKRPWVQPYRSHPDRVAEVVIRCPTGALQFERRDGGAEEPIPDANIVAVAADGPLYVRGDIEITDSTGTTVLEDTRVALCRCGESMNKPFCDNSHRQANFRDVGLLGENRLAARPDGGGRKLRIVPGVDGPLILSGEIEIRSADGKNAYHGTKTALCRCGYSMNKPFCDGSHARAMWRSE